MTYTPAANYNGPDTITYTVSDGQGGESTATVAVGVTPVNDGPVAVDDTATTAEDTPVTIDVLSNDTDVEGDALSVVTDAGKAPTALHGTVTVNADGTLTYTPAANYNGPDTITYTVSDGHGGESTATVAVGVTPVNDGPVAVDDTATTAEDTPVTIDVLSNDTDVEGDTLSVVTDAGKAPTALHGTVTVNADGTLTYTPAANYNGPDTITYTVSDGQGGESTATVAVGVTPVNDGPVAVDDTATTAEDTPVTIDVLSNDTDVEGDALSVVTDAGKAPTALHGTVTVNADGTLTYTPAANYNGPDTITYTVSDGHGGESTATVAVGVTPVNDGPVAVDDTATTAEDTPVTIDVLSNDTDVEGDTLSVVTDAGKAPTALHGTVTVNADGTLTYTPAANYNGPDTITYTVSDGQGGESTATVAVGVTPVNDGPVAVDDTATTAEDTPVTIDVLSNDTDVEGDALSVVTDAGKAPTALHGTVTVNADGTLTYTPAANYNGPDTITYTVSDGHGGESTATVAVGVTPVNDGPVAVDDTATTAEDTPVTIDVLSNDTDVEGDALSVVTDAGKAPTALHGTVTVNADGTLTYTPAANYNGPDTITYTVSDGQGGESTATVAVGVTPVNDGPVAVDDTATTAEDTPVTIDVLSNDTDVEGDALSVATDAGKAPTALHGTVTVNADGTLTYTPAANYNGPDTITYTVSDGQGGESTATVAVGVTPVNDGPVAVDDTATTAEDTPVTIDVLSNDTDVEGDALSVATDAGKAPTALHGTVTVNADGTLTYTPAANYNGPDTITYTVSDGHGGESTATVAVGVTPVNDGPVAVDDTATTAEDTPVTIDVLSNDTDVEGDALSVVTDAGKAPTALHGTVTVNADGTLTYTPAANYNGPDTITYTVSDGHGGESTATVAVGVTPVNDGPVAVDDTATTAEDTPVTIDVLSNDTDVEGDALSVVTDAGKAPTALHGTVTVNADGTLTYTPAANYNGPDTITYTVSDGQGGESTATVAVGVTPVNDGPVAVDDTATTAEDTPVTIDVLSNDTDVEGDALSVATDAGKAPTALHGTVTVNADGTLTYTPAANYNGPDTITYTVSDGQGGESTATVAVGVTPVNDGPVAVDDTATTAEDTPVTIDVLSNDTDVEGDALSVATDAGKAPTALHGTVTVNADGTLTYTPAANYNGPDTITYTVSDGHGGESTATVAMTVNEVNDVDTTPDTATAYEDWYNPVGNVLFNDSEWYRLEVTGAGHENGEQGMVVKGDYGTLYIGANGWYRYELDNSLDAVQALGRDETVTENFTYTVSDGQGGTSTTPLTITVHGMNDLPVANDDTLVTSEAQSAVIDVLANDTDVDGDVLSVVGEPYAPHGTVVVNDDGTLTYTPDQGFVGQDTIYYYMTDGSHYYTQAEVSVTVNQNLAPIAGDDQFSTAEDTSLSITAAQLLANDSDPEGTGLTITEVHNGAHGTVELVNGEITFTPDADYNGDATFTYTVADASGKETTATATVTVTATNDAPVAVDDEFGATTVIEPVTISVDVALHESHPNIEANWASKGVIVKAFAGNGLDQSTWLGEGEGPKPKLDHGNIDWDGDHHNDYTGLAVKSVHNLNNEQIDLLDGSEGTGTELLAVSFDGKTVQSVTLTLGALFDADDGAIWNGDLTEMARVAAFDADGNLLGYVDVDGDLDGLVNVTLDVAELGYPAPIAEVAVMPLQNGAGDDPANSDFVLKAVTATTTGGVEGVFYEDQTIELDATQLITAANAAGEADSDVDGDLLTVTDVFNPTHGSVTLTDEGKVVFEPDDDFSGQATFQYTVSDGHGGTDTATVTLNITPNDNEAPSIDLDATGSNFDINAEASDSWGYNLLGMYVLDDAGNPVVTEVLYDYSNVDGPRDLNPGDLLTHLEEGQTPHFFVLNSEEVRTGPAFREDVEITSPRMMTASGGAPASTRTARPRPSRPSSTTPR
nr:Ig-like domain-containing protein [Salidesulfovibrio onnuriiensis]